MLRIWLSGIVVAALCAAAALALAPSPRSTGGPLLRADTSGTLTLENSRDGRAIFRLQELAPGRSGRGTVTLANSGSLPGSLSLAESDLWDGPGSSGEPLSAAALLTVTDVTAGSNETVYSGTLDAFGALDLVTLVPGDARTYRFSVALPDGGPPSADDAGDNAFQDATSLAAYEWRLTESPPTRCGNLIRGEGGRQLLVGTLTGDTIAGGPGADAIRGRRGDDCLTGGRGRDRVFGDEDDDLIDPGRGADRVDAGPGDDEILARGDGRDLVRCGAGKDVVRASPADRLRDCEG